MNGHVNSRLVDCEWSKWQSWSECTKTCGGGSQTTKRTIIQEALDGGKHCIESNSKTQTCHPHPCPSKHKLAYLSLDKISVWISDTIYINTFTTLISVNCKWTPFGEWSECSKKCSGGTRQSVRRIAQKSLYGGTDCEGEVARIESCNENPCPSNV